MLPFRKKQCYLVNVIIGFKHDRYILTFMIHEIEEKEKQKLSSVGESEERGTTGRRKMEVQQENPSPKRPRTSAPSPIVRLNIGGSDRNIRRSLLILLSEASNSNPLCGRLLNEHWSNSKFPVKTITDDQGASRVYLDRNPVAFDDLLSYIEYGVDFLRGICKQDGGSIRLAGVRRECDYFTVGSFSRDVDSALYGEPISIGVKDWARIAAEAAKDKQNVVRGWNWISCTGNEGLLSLYTGRGKPAIADVHTSGLYLVFFSISSLACGALYPTQGFMGDHDEFCTLSVFHDQMTNSDDSHWNIPLLRSGAFDYRPDEERRQNGPLLFTAACADVVSLRQGNEMYCEHGQGAHQALRSPRMSSAHRDYPGALHYMTFIKLSPRSNIARFNVVREDSKSESTNVIWKSCSIDHQKTNRTPNVPVYLSDKDNTKIRFNVPGHYIIIGRVAARLKKNYHRQDDEPAEKRPRISFDVCNSFGVPLQTLPEVVSFISLRFHVVVVQQQDGRIWTYQ